MSGAWGHGRQDGHRVYSGRPSRWASKGFKDLGDSPEDLWELLQVVPAAWQLAAAVAALAVLVLAVLPISVTLSYEAMLRRGSDALWARAIGRSLTCQIVRVLFYFTAQSKNKTYGKLMDQAARKVAMVLAGSPPLPGSVCFVGGSGFSYWRHLGKDMRPVPSFNAAFGGSRSSDVVRHLSLVTECAPSVVVYCCGLTELVVFGQDPQELCRGFQRFVKALWHWCRIPVVFVGILRTPLSDRMGRLAGIDEANHLVRTYVAREPDLAFVEPPPLLTEDFLGDLHHLSERGYAKLADELRTICQRLLAPGAVQLCLKEAAFDRVKRD